jgi:membrane protein YqaA with SNARE-associated domain
VSSLSSVGLAIWDALHDASTGAIAGKKSSGFLGWLMHLGGVGLFALAIVDSSVVPIPLPGSTDLVLLLLTAFRSSSPSSPIIFASSAFAGSVIGGYMAWAAGKKGGEAALERLGKGRFVARVQRWVKRNGILSVWLAAVHPPSIPLLPFTLAAGALGLSLPRFMIAYCTGRAVRYGFIAWLGHKYGRQVVMFWEKDLKGWTTPILSVYIALLVLGAAYGFWKYRKEMRKGAQPANA